MAATTAAEAIKALNDKVVDVFLRSDPLYAPIYGIRGKFEDDIFRVSKEHQLEDLQFFHDVSAEVAALEKDFGATMTPKDLGDVRFLKYAIEVAIDQIGVPGEKGYYIELSENHMGGNLMHFEMGFAMYQPAATQEDFDNYRKRLEKVPSRFDDIITNFRHGIARKVTLPKSSIELLIKKCKESSGEGKEDLDAYVRAMPMAKAEEAKTVTGDEAYMVEHIKKYVLPSFAKVGKFLEEEYLPHARTNDGLYGLDGYKEAYEAYIFQNTTVRYKADEIHALGLKEVERIAALMEQAKASSGFTGTLAEFRAAINDRTKFPQLYFENPAEEVIPYYVDIMKRATEKMKEYFAKFPKFECEIAEVPAFMEKQAPLAFYNPGTPEKSGVFRANMLLHKTKPKHVAVAVCLHEAMPGHHQQISIALEKEDEHLIRKFVMETAYAEGWGLYSEYLGEEMGFYSDPLDYYGRLECEMQRALRLVVDSGLHAQGWTIEQGVEEMAKYLSLPREELYTEVKRYAVIPGQALSYKIGELKIKELRKLAEAELGARFDIKQFHSVVIDDGSMPLQTLEEAVKDWISKVKSEE
ncbi:hypothetical protein HDU96_002390 [Phlyctochytrium bullatum]|nr:hypothetical protein HDU96_002390 [Phlyctochytrium bullatum]